MRRLLAPALLILTGVLVAPAHATHGVQEMVQVSVYAPPRVYDHVSTLPVEEFERSRPPTTFRINGHGQRVYWNNTVIGGYTVAQALRSMRRHSLASVLLADRRLTASERKRFREAFALYDDADVMVVAVGHPACQGITRAQARDIVAGRVTRWSQVVTGAGSEPISVRYRGSGAQADLRFGARYVRRSSGRYRPSYPPGSRGSADGGIRAAASGDQSVAAVTAWSRFQPQPGVCAVPLNGTAPSDASVSARTYPEAFRVTYVVPRRRPRSPVQRKAAQIVQAFMKSDTAKAYLARRGLLVVGGAPTTNAGGGGTSPSVAAPATDHAGRPITTTPEGSGEHALTGLRLDSPPTAEGFHRFALESQGTLHRLTFDASGTCTAAASGGWTVKGAWRYPEYGGGLIARLGWFIGDGVSERVIDLPQSEPATVYLDATAYASSPGAPATC